MSVITDKAVSAFSSPERPETPGLISFRDEKGDLRAAARGWVDLSPDFLHHSQAITSCIIRTNPPWLTLKTWKETILTLDGKKQKVWVDLTYLCRQKNISEEKAIELCDSGMLSCAVRSYQAAAALLYKRKPNANLKDIQYEAREALNTLSFPSSSRLHGHIALDWQTPLGEGSTKRALSAVALGSGARLVAVIPNTPSDSKKLHRSLERSQALINACQKFPKLAAVCTLPVATLSGQPYRVLYEQGTPLSLLLRNKLNIRSKIDYTCQLLHAVQIIHAYRLVHFDIKPDNLLLFENQSPSLKLTDFDFSAWSHEPFKASGSPAYLDLDLCPLISKEIIWPHTRRQKSDLFSTGMTLCEIFFPLIFNILPHPSYDTRAISIFNDLSRTQHELAQIPQAKRTLLQQTLLVAAEIICGLIKEKAEERWSIEQALKKCKEFPTIAEEPNGTHDTVLSIAEGKRPVK